MTATLLQGGCWKCWMPLEMSKERRGIPWMERCGWADACAPTVYVWSRVSHILAFQSIRTSHQLSGSGPNHACLAPAHPTLAWPGCSSRTSQRHLSPSCRLRPSPRGAAWGVPHTCESGAALPLRLQELAQAAVVPARWLRHVNSQKGGGTCCKAPSSRAGGGSRTHPLGAHSHIRDHPSASLKPG